MNDYVLIQTGIPAHQKISFVIQSLKAALPSVIVQVSPYTYIHTSVIVQMPPHTYIHTYIDTYISEIIKSFLHCMYVGHSFGLQSELAKW